MPSKDLVHRCHCVGEYSFGLDICLPSKSATLKGSVVFATTPSVDILVTATSLDLVDTQSKLLPLLFPFEQTSLSTEFRTPHQCIRQEF